MTNPNQPVCSYAATIQRNGRANRKKPPSTPIPRGGRAKFAADRLKAERAVVFFCQPSQSTPDFPRQRLLIALIGAGAYAPRHRRCKPRARNPKTTTRSKQEPRLRFGRQPVLQAQRRWRAALAIWPGVPACSASMPVEPEP
jgi:hypothetical protein